jgi:hypothetical protein
MTIILFFFWPIFLLLCCGYIVASTKVLIICQIYHTWIYPLHHSPLSLPTPILGIVSTGLIFPFTYIYTQYLHQIHPPTPFPHILLSMDTNPPQPTKTHRTCFALLFSDFVKEKNDIFVYTGSSLMTFPCVCAL